jgi:hypothetical protein
LKRLVLHRLFAIPGEYNRARRECGRLSGLQPELIEGAKQFGRVRIDAKCTGTQEFTFAVAATQEPDTQNPRAARRELVPDSITNHIALARRKPESLLAGDKQVRLRLGAWDVATFDDHDSLPDTKHFERAINLGASAGGGYTVCDVPIAQVFQ